MDVSADFRGGPWDGAVADFRMQGGAPGVIWGHHHLVEVDGIPTLSPYVVFAHDRHVPTDVGPYVLVEREGPVPDRHLYEWSPESVEMLADFCA